jgi:hypothetical protein
MKTTKTTKTTVAPAAPVVTMTPEERAAEKLGYIQEDIAGSIKAARQTLARNTKQMADAMATIAGNLDCQTTNDDFAAAYNMTQSYWPLRAAAEAAGELKVLSEIATTLAELKETGQAPMAILTRLLQVVTGAALRDTSRTESSSNAYSNAMAADAGNGRGKVYRDVVTMIQIFLEKNAG